MQHATLETEALTTTHPADRTRLELNTVFLDSIYPIAKWLAILFSIFAALHAIMLPEYLRVPMIGLALSSAAASIFFGLLVRRDWFTPELSWIPGLGLVGLALLNSSVHILVTQDVSQSTNFALILVCIGLFFVSRPHFLAAIVLTLATWSGTAFLLGSLGPPLDHFDVMIFQAAAIALVAHEIRLRSHCKLIGMRVEAEVREAKLEEALLKARLYAEAQRENKARTEFLANMSHELRTPLNAIIGFSEVMSQEMFGPLGSKRYVDYAHDIHDAGSHLLSLVNDILDLSRIQLDDKSLNYEEVDPRALAENCTVLLRPRAQEKNIRIHCDVGRAPAVVATDARRFKQIAINLLANAVKFTPNGGEVSLSIETSGDDGGILLRVDDTGIGMTPQEIAHATVPFWQADSGLDRTQCGSGLGLALVKELVSAMGGQMKIESTPGVGTTVAVELPRPALRPVPGFEDTDLDVFMELEVDRETTEIHARVQA